MKDFEDFEGFIHGLPLHKKFWESTPDSDLDGSVKLPQNSNFSESDTNDICFMIKQVSLRILKEYHEWSNKKDD